VKQGHYRPLTKKPVTASEEEIARNPRPAARSCDPPNEFSSAGRPAASGRGTPMTRREFGSEAVGLEGGALAVPDSGQK